MLGTMASGPTEPVMKRESKGFREVSWETTHDLELALTRGREQGTIPPRGNRKLENILPLDCPPLRERTKSDPPGIRKP